jgi:hypothetical protein
VTFPTRTTSEEGRSYHRKAPVLSTACHSLPSNELWRVKNAKALFFTKGFLSRASKCFIITNARRKQCDMSDAPRRSRRIHMVLFKRWSRQMEERLLQLRDSVLSGTSAATWVLTGCERPKGCLALRSWRNSVSRVPCCAVTSHGRNEASRSVHQTDHS